MNRCVASLPGLVAIVALFASACDSATSSASTPRLPFPLWTTTLSGSTRPIGVSAGTLVVGGGFQFAGIATAAPGTAGQIRWQRNSEGPFSTAQVAATVDGALVGAIGSVYALDAATGLSRWQTSPIGSYGNVSADATQVYAPLALNSDSAGVVALTLGGAVVWTSPRLAACALRCTFVGTVVSRDTVYATGTAQLAVGSVGAVRPVSLAVALNRVTGAPFWTWLDSLSGVGLGDQPTASGNALIVQTADSMSIVAIDRFTRSKLWQHDVSGRMQQAPVVAGTRVIAADASALRALRIENGSQVWQRSGTIAFFLPSFAVCPNTVVLSTGLGVYGFDLATGAITRANELLASLGARMRTFDDKVYIVGITPGVNALPCF